MQEIFVPALGMASTEVHLTEWLKQPGDTIADDDAIALIETDKAELEVRSPGAGILGRHRYEAGTDVPNGATIATLLGIEETEDAAPAAAAGAASAPGSSAPPVGSAPQEVGLGRRRDPVTGELEPHVQSPRQRSGIALAPATVELAVAARTAPSISPRQDAATDRYRIAVAAAVTRSWNEIPHFVVTRDLRIERLQEVLRGFRIINQEVTFTDVLLKAYALSLIERMGTTDIVLGLAVATPRGVAIPVLTNVAVSSVLAIAKARHAAITRALDSRHSPDDAIIPHSTLSNLGAFGVDSFTAIIPLGQTSILSVGAGAKRPVVVEGVLTVGTTMNVTLNVDHREWDGQHAATVLQKLAAIAAEPSLLIGLA